MLTLLMLLLGHWYLRHIDPRPTPHPPVLIILIVVYMVILCRRHPRAIHRPSEAVWVRRLPPGGQLSLLGRLCGQVFDKIVIDFVIDFCHQHHHQHHQIKPCGQLTQCTYIILNVSFSEESRAWRPSACSWPTRSKWAITFLWRWGWCCWWQGCISCGPCSYPELTEDRVLPSA